MNTKRVESVLVGRKFADNKGGSLRVESPYIRTVKRELTGVKYA